MATKQLTLMISKNQLMLNQQKIKNQIFPLADYYLFRFGQFVKKSTFDFSKTELFGRLKKTLLLSELPTNFQERPDFFNPMWISLLFIVILTIFSTLTFYIVYPNNHLLIFKISFQAFVSVICFSVLMPVIFWIFLVFTGMDKIENGFIFVISLFNYANIFYIFASILATLPFEIVKCVAFGLAAVVSFKFLSTNFASFFLKKEFEHIKTPILAVLLIQTSAALIYMIKFHWTSW